MNRVTVPCRCLAPACRPDLQAVCDFRDSLMTLSCRCLAPGPVPPGRRLSRRDDQRRHTYVAETLRRGRSEANRAQVVLTLRQPERVSLHLGHQLPHRGVDCGHASSRARQPHAEVCVDGRGLERRTTETWVDAHQRRAVRESATPASSRTTGGPSPWTSYQTLKRRRRTTAGRTPRTSGDRSSRPLRGSARALTRCGACASPARPRRNSRPVAARSERRGSSG